MDIKFTSFPTDTNWVKGMADNFIFEAKLFDEGSEFGINNGRVSKLSIQDNNNWIVNYDRGWDIKPNKEYKKQYTEILNFLELSPKRFEKEI